MEVLNSILLIWRCLILKLMNSKSTRYLIFSFALCTSGQPCCFLQAEWYTKPIVSDQIQVDLSLETYPVMVARTKVDLKCNNAMFPLIMLKTIIIYSYQKE